MWKCSNKATFCKNFPTKPVVVEIFYKGNSFVEFCHKDIFWWKLATKATFLWKFTTRVAAVFLWKFFNNIEYSFLLKFSLKTPRHLEGILRQNSVNFGKNFLKIHQTAKISAQQRCHAARVFVTLGIRRL